MSQPLSHSKRAFTNDTLERLSRVTPSMPALMFGPIALYLFVLAVIEEGGLVATALFAAGVLAWSLAEYILHRWVFHWRPVTPALQQLWYPVHMLHHDVQEWDRLVAPPLMSLPFFCIFLGAFYGLLGAPAMYGPFAGFCVGYLAYDYVHLYTHFARPTTRLGKALRRRHLQHHFKHPDRWYGVSSPLWDYVFRTHVAGELSTTHRGPLGEK